jgi:hypothetical protein
MNSIKLILAFLISFPVFNVNADTFFGTLRGENVIELKSPFSGIIEHNVSIDGAVHENTSPLKIKSYELESKKKILKLKIKTLKSKINRLQKEYTSAKLSFDRGYISHYEIYKKKDVIDEAKINLQELCIELSAIINTLDLGNPVINSKFLVRQFHTVDKQIVNAGDRIVSIETIDNFFIDIKFDPVSMKGRIQDKVIDIKSMVTGQTGKAIVFRVSNPVDNTFTQGSKIATLLVTTDGIALHQLLDTIFEVTIHDKN